MNGKRAYGDYQTPAAFAERVCRYLAEHRQIKPSAVVEPTCGVGSFLKSSLLFNAKEYYGIEINSDYCHYCRQTIPDARVRIINADFFAFSSRALIRDPSQVLILGNPPWATNSALSVLNSDNLPQKENLKGLNGFAAITGESNFDICEYMILQIIREYSGTNAVIAMLCKTTVARNVFQQIKRENISFSAFDMLEFNAAKVFEIAASACLLVIQLSEASVGSEACNVYTFDHPERPISRFGYSDGRFYSDLDAEIENFDGKCCFEWRQGVKHDCAKIMELTMRNGTLQNGNNEPVQIESDIVFPLIKSSMFKSPVIHSFSKYVIVTQKKAREETARLEHEAPRAWEYLNGNRAMFERRKSVIYRGAPPFSVFGVGEYSYARYKVGVSGFYKQPLFSVLYSDDDKPVMTDDTSYFICFDDYDMAYISMLLLNSDKVQAFLKNIAFLDAKRPYTKKILERLDFGKIVSATTIEGLAKTEASLGLPAYVSPSMYRAFQSLLQLRQARRA